MVAAEVVTSATAATRPFGSPCSRLPANGLTVRTGGESRDFHWGELPSARFSPQSLLITIVRKPSVCRCWTSRRPSTLHL